MAEKKDSGNSKNMEELVNVKLPLTREKQDDVFVSLNGRNMKIKRGVAVAVPRWAYEILKNSEEMDTLALERQRGTVKQF